jgi:hypothetical protein
VFASAMMARDTSRLPPALRRVAQIGLAVTVMLTASRTILAFVLSAAVRQASTPARRRAAVVLALFSVVALAALSALNLQLDTRRPWDAHLSPEPSVRAEAVRTSLATLLQRPLFGVGPGGTTGLVAGVPMDAHLTPLNVAATLGVPALLALAWLVVLLWRGRRQPTDRASWGLLAGLALDGLGQDVEDFRHTWIALGMADGPSRDQEAAPSCGGSTPIP